MLQSCWLLKSKRVLELAIARNLGQASFAVPVAASPVAGATSALFGRCFLLSFVLGHGEVLTPMLPSTGCYWFDGSTPFLRQPAVT